MDTEQIVPMHLTVTPKRIAVKLFVVWEQNMLFSNTISLQIRELSKRKVDYVCPFFFTLTEVDESISSMECCGLRRNKANPS